jgi:hypothetical protein
MCSFERDIKISASMKGAEFVDRTNDWHTLKINCLRELKICLMEWPNCAKLRLFFFQVHGSVHQLWQQ